MILNFWRPISLFRPKKAGWYQCTVRVETYNTRVMNLYFDTIEGGKWLDLKRQKVFDGYKVYKPGRETLEYHRVHTDELCERIDILAWRKLPRPYGWWKKKGERYDAGRLYEMDGKG